VTPKAVRALALYLPQFHPIPENDAWWGKGFTEWRNVVRTTSLFPGHYQPQLPADLGFCDLRVPETREAQAAMASGYGITGFVYHHYWFRGRRLLDRPFREVLESGSPDFPFALSWANEPWTRAWDGRTSEVLIRQEYSVEDDREHIRHLLPAFADPRYVRVDGRPLFIVYAAGKLPDPRRTTDCWREEAVRAGVGEPYLCRWEWDGAGEPTELGFDATIDFQPDFSHLGPALRRSVPARALRRLHLTNAAYRRHRIFDYGSVIARMQARPPVPYKRFPCVTPGWDNTPRRRRQGIVLRDSTPEAYERWLRATVEAFVPFGPGEDLVFLNAWNEWAEGNHLEPCLRWGRGYLEATRRALSGD